MNRKTHLLRQVHLVETCLKEIDRLIQQNNECIKLIHEVVERRGANRNNITINNNGGKLS